MTGWMERIADTIIRAGLVPPALERKRIDAILHRNLLDIRVETWDTEDVLTEYYALVEAGRLDDRAFTLQTQRQVLEQAYESIHQKREDEKCRSIRQAILEAVETKV